MEKQNNGIPRLCCFKVEQDMATRSATQYTPQFYDYVENIVINTKLKFSMLTSNN